MKKFLTAALAIGALAVIPASAQASPIRECGNFLPTGVSGPPAHLHYWGRWTYHAIAGTPVFNLTTRNVNCANARSAALQIMEVNRTYPWHGFHLRWAVYDQGWSYDVRAVRGGQVIHWQGSAGD